MVEVTVEGLDPAPQGSKSYVGGRIMKEACSRLPAWRKAVALEATLTKQHISSACFVGIVFKFRRPKAHFKKGGGLRAGTPEAYVVKRNDIDKCCRSTLDGLVQGGLLADDCLVVRLIAERRYCLLGESPGAAIQVVPLSEEGLPPRDQPVKKVAQGSGQEGGSHLP